MGGGAQQSSREKLSSVSDFVSSYLTFFSQRPTDYTEAYRLWHTPLRFLPLKRTVTVWTLTSIHIEHKYVTLEFNLVVNYMLFSRYFSKGTLVLKPREEGIVLYNRT